MSADERLVNLDVALAKHIAPRIRMFASTDTGYPAEFDTREEWTDVLTRIAWAFEFVGTDHYYNPNPDEIAQFDSAMHEFARWYRRLWI